MNPEGDTDRLSTDDAVTQIIGEFFERIERGESCAGFAFVAAHPLAVGREDVLAECRKVIEANELIDWALAPAPEDASANDHDPATFTLPGFEVYELLGGGGMGSVYRGKQRSLGREVALKVIRPDHAGSELRQKMFAREADALAKLQTPHIVPVIDVLPSERGPVLVMALIRGPNLGQIIDSRAALAAGPPDRVEVPGFAQALLRRWRELPEEAYFERLAETFEQLLSALSVVHAQGLLHRDIKPSNVLIDDRGAAWLGDFGLVRVEPSPDGIPTPPSGANATTMSGRTPGTHGFIAPEIAAGEQGGERADLFSFGVMIYQAFTGRLPYGRRLIDCNEPLPEAPVQRMAPASRDGWRKLDEIVLRALYPQPELRYATAEEMLADWRTLHVDSARTESTDEKPATPRGSVPKRGNPVRRWRLIGAVALLFVLLAMTVNTYRPGWLRGRGASSGASLASSSAGESPAAVAPPLATWDVVQPVDLIGADVALIPLDELGRPMVERVLGPIQAVDGIATFHDVSTGDYLVEAVGPRGEFHQVYRRVPVPGEIGQLYRHLFWEQTGTQVTWHVLEILPKHRADVAMTLYEGGSFPAGVLANQAFTVGDLPLSMNGKNPPPVVWRESTSVNDFRIDTTEVTYGEVLKLMSRTQVLGIPADVNSRLDHACANVSFDAATAYAELVGKRIPTSAEILFAATNRGTTRLPWGDEWPGGVTPWVYGAAVGSPEFDCTRTDPPVKGLMSNVGEWTSSWGGLRTPGASFRIIRGSPYDILQGKTYEKLADFSPRYYHVVTCSNPILDRYPFLGFRCAKSVKPLVLKGTRTNAKNGADLSSTPGTP